MIAVDLIYLIEAGADGHIDLAADDGLDALLLGCPVKIHRPVHDPVVGDGHGGLPQGLGPATRPSIRQAPSNRLYSE